MRRHLLMIHYTPPSEIGGVEHIMVQHARLLATHGWDVRMVAGRKPHGDVDVRVDVIPEIDAANPGSDAIETELTAGAVTPRFHHARRKIRDELEPLLMWADAVIAHNAFTLHFSLPLTAALWELAGRGRRHNIIAWCHDLAWTNPLYIPGMFPGYPWELLRVPAPHVQYITVSEQRRRELLELWDLPSGEVAVVPNGIDVGSTLRLSPEILRLAHDYRLFDRDAVLVLPVRITRRKNIQAAIRAVAALRRRGLDVCFLVSGPIAPHHPGRSHTYLETLIALADDLGVRDSVIFLAEERGKNLDDQGVYQLYDIADLLLFPSAQEGFGLPILEAGLARVPVVLSDIPIFREVGGDDVWRFDLDAAAEDIAECIVEALQSRPGRLFRRVLREYRWDAVIEQSIVPLLERTATQEREAQHV